MEKSPDQVLARMYEGILVIMVLLLVGAGIATFLNAEISGYDIATMLIRYYLLAIPGAMMAFTIAMFIRREMNLAIAGMIVSVSWLVFKWMG